MTDETPMRERIARVIYDALEGPVNNGDATRQMRQWELSLRIADAVLDAMREPSEQVVKYAAMAVRDFYTEEGPYPRTRAMWKASIDAAKEGK